MADLEVMITMGQYKNLKEFESKCKLSEAKSKQIEDKLWKTEQKLKLNQQELFDSNVKVKQLSLNALKLAKKVMISEDLLGNQEDRWLKREKDLLQKLIESIKTKEHLQVEIQMGKEILRLKDQKIEKTNEALKRIESQLLNCQKQKESFKMLHQKTLKELKNLSIKHDEMMSEYEQKLNRLRQQYVQKIKLSEEEVERLLVKNNQSQQLVKEMKVSLHQRQEQIVKACKTANQNIAAERQKHQNLLKEKEQKYEQLRTKLRQNKQNLLLRLQQLSLGVIQISSQLKSTLQFIEKQKQRFQQQQSKVKAESEWIFERLSDKLNSFQLLEKQLQSQNRGKQIEIQRLQELYRTQKDQNRSKQTEIRRLQELCRTQKEAFETQKVSLNTKLLQLQLQNAKFTKIKDQLKRLKCQLQKQLIQSQNRVQQLQKELNQRNSYVNKMQQQNSNLKQLNYELQREKEAERQYELRSANFREQQVVQMNTQTLEIAHDTIYGKKEGSKISQNYKQKVDNLWTPISEYLKAMKTKIIQDQALQTLHTQILAQQLKLILQRFVYLFEKEMKNS